jgi:hypothetical protein
MGVLGSAWETISTTKKVFSTGKTIWDYGQGVHSALDEAMYWGNIRNLALEDMNSSVDPYYGQYFQDLSVYAYLANYYWSVKAGGLSASFSANMLGDSAASIPAEVLNQAMEGDFQPIMDYQWSVVQGDLRAMDAYYNRIGVVEQ